MLTHNKLQAYIPKMMKCIPFGYVIARKIEPIYPSKTGLKAGGFGRSILTPAHLAGQGRSPEYAKFFNFSNWTIMKGDTTIFVKPCQKQNLGYSHKCGWVKFQEDQ